MSINFPYMLTKYISYGRRIIGITIDMILIVIPNGKIKNLYNLFSSILDILPFIQIIHKTAIKYDESSTAYVKFTKGSPNKCTRDKIHVWQRKYTYTQNISKVYFCLKETIQTTKI